jgi:hypothetical protein
VTLSVSDSANRNGKFFQIDYQDDSLEKRYEQEQDASKKASDATNAANLHNGL